MSLPGFTAEASLYGRASSEPSIPKDAYRPRTARSANTVNPASSCKDYGGYLICTEGCDGDPWCLLGCYYGNCT